MKKKLRIFVSFVVFEAIFIPILSIILIYYGPFTTTRDMLVTTAMTTMNHQYIAKWFLSDKKINEILQKNRPQEVLADQQLDEIKVSQKADSGVEIIDVSSNNFKGYLMVVNDPSRVKLATAPKLGTVGATTSQIVEANDAIGGINAGGFADDALGTGGKAAGIIIENGELKTTNMNGSYSIVGIDSENKMIVSNSMTYSKMKQLNLKSAVSFGPVIIINGQSTIKSGDGGWGIQPRTAIGQKKDGSILMLVIDGRQTSSIGATLKNVQDILLKYGAYNAFNLDGGASSTMIYDNKVINKPSDIMGERYVPSAFIVTKAK
jgi:exopolysaccharide biosynthesis protein